MVLKEYGGYIEWEHYFGAEYHEGYRFDSVRSALMALIDAKRYRHVYMPVFICSCFRELFDLTGLEYTFYNIDRNFKPIADFKSFSHDSLLLIVNYFGQLQINDINDLASKYNIFLDNTQAFFYQKLHGIDMANSCRKYLGVADGAYLYSSHTFNMDCYDFNNIIDKVGCLIGRYEESASNYYGDFVKNEETIRGNPIKRMSRFTQNILKSLDYNRIIELRKNNFLYLDECFSKVNEIQVVNYAGYFMYPLLIPKGRFVKKELIKRKIYVPTLWPGVDEIPICTEWEQHLEKDTIWLPIDQRYNQDDMKFIARNVKDLL